MIDLSWGAAAPKTESPAGDVNVQGSEAWLKWRGKGIGSSDAAVLLGWSPWKTVSQLYEEKLGLWKQEFGFAQKRAMERGKDLEPKIRFWYEQNYRGGAQFPDSIATDEEKPHRRASFDGANKTFKNPEDGSIGRMIEIKAPNAKDHALAEMGEVPEKYIPQVQWLMMIGKLPWADYVSFGTDGTYHVVSVKADPILQAELAMRADLFWKHVETKTPITEWEKFHRGMEPLDLTQATSIQTEKTEGAQLDLLPQEDPPQITDQAIEAIVAEALTAKDERDRSVARYDALTDKLKKILGNDKERTCGEAVFGWTEKKGNVDYSVIPELIGLDLEQFRKPKTRSFYFKRKGEK